MERSKEKVRYIAEEVFCPHQWDLEEDLHQWSKQVQWHLKNLDINEVDISIIVDGKYFQRHHWSMWSVDEAIETFTLSKLGIYDRQCKVMVEGQR